MGKNAQVTYHISGNVQMTLSEGLESLKVAPFIMNKDTGVISLNFDPQKGMKGYFDFEIVANDTDGLFDKARVFVSIINDDSFFFNYYYACPLCNSLYSIKSVNKNIILSLNYYLCVLSLTGKE